MVFSTTNLFKGIACPEGEECQLTNCIFSHELRPQSGETKPAGKEIDRSEGPVAKRRKIAADDQIRQPLSRSDQIREQLAAARKGLPEKHSLAPGLPPSLSKPVTPPPTNGKKSTHIAPSSSSGVSNNNNKGKHIDPKSTASGPKENLNPRRVTNDPAGHSKRTLYLKHMHSDMVRLNQRVADAEDLKDNKLLHLTEHELVTMALDEEEALARTQASLYTNKIKQRVVAYKKMDLEGWVNHVKVTVIEPRSKNSKQNGPDEKVIDTGLSPDEEVLLLPFLVADQSSLAPHGYISIPPSASQAAEARAAVEASKNFEVCDRCGSRFQVFPERNEDGLLTSNGPCRFHPSRKAFPQKTKNDYNAGAKQPYYPCCNEPVGSAGCATHESHVFKCAAPARLAAVLPFITTPERASATRDRHGRVVAAVSFDCEMGYTTCGLELIRLTAVSWPRGEELVDVLVRPVGTIIDLNSRFSGVFPEHFAHAIPYEQWMASAPPPPPSTSTPPRDDRPAPDQILPLVPSVAVARALLTAHLAPSTPLIGHAIDNDLNATRLCHPTIVDTVLLYRHPRGMPYRFGLRQLALQHLGRRIQQGGERGHDSAEDARATGELVRVKVAERWRMLQAKGWRVEGGVLLGKDGEEVGGVGAGVGKEIAWRAFEGEGVDGGRRKGKTKTEKEGGSGSGNGGGDGDGMEGEVDEGRSATAGTGLAAFLPRGRE